MNKLNTRNIIKCLTVSGCLLNANLLLGASWNAIGADTINTYNQNNQCGAPLHNAVLNGNVDAVKRLLEQGVGVNDQDSNGQTPLHLVAQRGSSEIAKVLLKGGAKIDIRDNEGATPMYRAIENGNWSVYNVLFAWETFLSLAAYFAGND